MSFILDALRRSERARRALEGAPQGGPPVAPRPHVRARWPLLLAALLVVNLGVLAWLVWTRDAQPVTTAPVAVTVHSAPTAGARSREVRPLAAEAPASDAGQAPAATAPAEPVGPLPPALGELPDLAARLPALEVQVHAWAADPAERFALINLKRYAEGERLAEGPLLVAIVPEGLILETEGRRFLLPRR